MIHPERIKRLQERCEEYKNTGLELVFHKSALNNTSIQVWAHEGTAHFTHIWVSLNGNSKQRRQQTRAALRQVKEALQ